MATEDLQINIGANTQDLQNGLNQASQSVQNFGAQVSKVAKPTADSTNALTNLSRVAQDAPYGFQGIANNLNPLLESFQRLSKEAGGTGGALKSIVSGLTGPAGIGLALGVVSSLVVKFGKDIGDWISNTTELEKAQRAVKEAFYDSLKGVEAGIAKDEALVSVINNVTLSTQARQAALNDLKAAHKGNLELQKIDINDTAALTALIDKQSEALIRKAKVEALSKILGEETAKLYKAQHADLEDMTAELGVLDKAWAGLKGFATGGTFMGGVMSQVEIASQAANKNKESIDKYTKSVNSLNEAIKGAVTEQYKLGDFNVTGTAAVKPTTVSTSADKKADVNTSVLETLKKQQKLYADDVYLFKESADKIAKEQRDVNLKKASLAKASASELAEIQKQYEIDLLLNEKDLGDKLTKMFDTQDKEWVKQQKDFEKEKLSNQLQASKDGLDIVKTNFDEESKLAGDDYEKKKEALQKAMAQVKMLMAFSSNPKAIQDLGKSYKDLEKQYKLLDFDEKQKDLKNVTKQTEKYAEVIASTLTQGIMGMWDAMQKGENPLQAIGNFLTDLVKKFAAAIIQASIFQGIMMLLPGGAAAASAGGGFFGSLKKILGMAEGGIVSRPTLAMVGEGGQSEAVMPLNKLSNMMNSTFNAGAMSGVGGGGSGSGQFVLKGNDLVLALQRSNYSLNLRRGNGI